MKKVMLPLLLLASLQAPVVRAEVKAGLGLGSRVNGVEGGSCKAGLCRIDGGSDSGRNRFHRLSRFDTRGAIRGVEIQSDGVRNLVLGVTAVEGSFIDKAVSLTSPAHLFLLSPGGIQLMPGGTFLQLPQLTLSTATQLHFPGGVFDVFSTPRADLPPLNGDPFLGRLGLRGSVHGEDRPWIRMDGIRIDVEESLLVDAPQGSIDITASQLSASNADGDGGSIALTADLIKVGADSQLLATGQRNGGEVLVGGSWQNSDPTVRQATQTWMQQGSVVDASSTGAGDGGTVVIWSDLSKPSGGTVAQGSLLARGGEASGNGGRIETSGRFLVAEPERLDVSSANGLAGTWLLDPYDITIAAGAVAGDITAVPSGGGQLFESSATSSRVNVTSIGTQISGGAGTNVRIATGPGGAGGGNITWQAGAPIDYSGSTGTLTLDASGYITLNSNITTGTGGLTLQAGAGYLEAAPGVTLALGGPLNVSTGDITIGTAGFASPELAATLTGTGPLTKTGTGRLILSGNSNTWSGTTNVQAGTLRVSGANALGTSASTKVLSGATLEIDGGISLAENIELNSGSTLLNWSGDNTITLPLLLRDNGSRVVDVRQDSLTLHPTAGKAVDADNNVVAHLTFAGSGDLVVQGIFDLDNGQAPATYGDFLQTGTGVARFKQSMIVDEVESNGGGTIWMDQPGGLPVSLPSTTSISLDNGSILRRDSSETVTGASLSLGAGGGGISVGNGFTLVWNSPITGAGTFTKAGDGTLRFPSTAAINYTGATNVIGGSLEVFSARPTTATCSGTGSSSLCTAAGGGGSGGSGGSGSEGSGGGGSEESGGGVDVDLPKPAPEPETKPETVETSEESEFESEVLTVFEELLDAVADVPVLLPADQSSTIASSSVESDSESSAADLAGPLTAQPQTGDSGLQVDFSGGTDSSASAGSLTAQTPVVAVNTQTVAPEQAAAQFQQSDQAATSRTAALLGLEQSNQTIFPATPSVEDIQNVLSRVERQGLIASPAVLQVRFTQLARGASDAERKAPLSLVPQDLEQRHASIGADRFLTKDFSPQALLERASDLHYASAHEATKANFQIGESAQSVSTLAVKDQNDDAFLDLTLIGSKAPVQARRVPLNRSRFAGLLQALYRQLSRQEPLAVDDPASPSRQLYTLLVAPILESLEGQDVETLLIAADQGLQAVPYAALSDGTSFFGEAYAFGLTPSLALTPLAPPSQSPSGGLLALGASEFESLAPLPLVPQELEQLDDSIGADRYLNEDFSPQALLKGAADQRYDRVHVATHADFRPGGPAQSVLHTGTGPMSMAQLAQLRSERSGTPLDLIVLSACRTLLGDQESELGFAGLALQAGARSAVGTLWYVDDVVTSAFFVQFYRLLDQGLPKAAALQRTRQLFASGAIRLEGDVVLGADETPLLTGLTPAQRRRMAGGGQNPYFWAGIELIGSPW